MMVVGSKPSQAARRTPSDNAKAVRPMRAKRFMLRLSTLARAGTQRHQLLDAGAGGWRGLRIRHDQIEPVLGRRRVARAPSSKYQKFARGVAEGAVIRRERLEATSRLFDGAGIGEERARAQRPPLPQRWAHRPARGT